MFNLIIRIDALNRHYPGGFEQYKKDNEEFIEGDIPLIWFDKHLVREGAMSANDIEQVV